ncbi:MAG: hypothetical protein Q9217_003729 [Psora testacea]
MPLDISPDNNSDDSDTFSSPSTPDPYDYPSPSGSPQIHALPSHIDLASLPAALPIFGPLSGYTTAYVTRAITHRYLYLAQTIKRPLTPEEQSAVAYHSAKSIAISSWGPTLGLAAGVYRTWRTRRVYRWPLAGKMKSEEVGKGFWDGEKMRLNGKEILRNVSPQWKSVALHLARGTAYVTASLFFVPLMVNAYAASVATVGELKDRRMGDVMRALSAVADAERRQRGRRAGSILSDQQREAIESKGRGRRGPIGQVGRDGGEIWREHREAIQKGRGGQTEVVDGDDASPTGGMGVFDFGEEEEREMKALRGGGSNTGMMGDSEMQERETRMQAGPGRGNGDRRPKNIFEIEKAQRQPQGFGDGEYDDASPTGGTGAIDPVHEGTSVWERIREGAASGGSGSMPSRRGGAVQRRQGGDDYSFSSSEEEKSYAQIEAQAKFDERVEKERRRGDFSDDGKRW